MCCDLYCSCVLYHYDLFHIQLSCDRFVVSEMCVFVCVCVRACVSVVRRGGGGGVGWMDVRRTF